MTKTLSGQKTNMAMNLERPNKLWASYLKYQKKTNMNTFQKLQLLIDWFDKMQATVFTEWGDNTEVQNDLRTLLNRLKVITLEMQKLELEITDQDIEELKPLRNKLFDWRKKLENLDD